MLRVTRMYVPPVLSIHIGLLAAGNSNGFLILSYGTPAAKPGAAEMTKAPDLAHGKPEAVGGEGCAPHRLLGVVNMGVLACGAGIAPWPLFGTEPTLGTVNASARSRSPLGEL